MVALPKISLGVSKKRNYFDKKHHYNGTADFGFCMPTLFDVIDANTKVHLRTSTFVRLGVLPQPSFAPMSVKQYNTYVPIHDVYEAYDYMCSSQTVQSAIKSYIPTSYDIISPFSQLLKGIILSTCQYNKTSKDFYLGLPLLWQVQHDSASSCTQTVTPQGLSASDINSLNTWFNQSINSSHTLGGNPCTFAGSGFADAIVFADMIHSINTGATTPAYAEETYASISKYLYITPSFDNADFVFKIKSNYTSSSDLYLTFHLTHEGKRLFKILQCIGYGFKYNKSVSILPLFAYYKAWFDMFNPHRKVQWRSTLCYKLIHGYYDNNKHVKTALEQAPNSSDPYNIYDTFFSFIHELPRCCYTLAIDPITVALNNPVEGNSFTGRFQAPTSDTSEDSVFISSDEVPGTNGDSSIITRALLKLLPMVNKNSVIGARVDKYMQLHYGTHLPDSYNFGKHSFDIDPSDVFSTASTESAHLGEYAGKGVGYGSTGKETFESARKGFILQFTVIVPNGSYSQSVNPLLHNFTRNSIYLSEYDGLGMAPLLKSTVFGTNSVFGANAGDDGTFGFVPRLMEYKYKFNVRAGGFANRSEKSQFLPYQLDRIFNEDEVTIENFIGENEKAIFRSAVDLRCDESLRYIGNDEAFGNYDRIFLDQSGVTDNFMLHIIQDYSIVAPMLPISQSFDTFDNDGLKDDDGHMNVSHS